MNVYDKKRRLERRLTPQQVRAAQLIVANEWGKVTNEDGKKMTNAELAEEIGIAASTLYNWKRIPEFIEYTNILTDLDLMAMRAEVNAAIMKLIRGDKTNGIPSVKALELYMKRFALLTNRVEVEKKEPTVNANIDEVRRRIEEYRRRAEMAKDDSGDSVDECAEDAICEE